MLEIKYSLLCVKNLEKTQAEDDIVGLHCNTRHLEATIG